MTQNGSLGSASVLTTPSGSKRTAKRRATSEVMRKYGHLLFVVPGLVFFVAVMVGPTLFALVISMTNWTGRGTSFEFIGLGNFQEALTYWPLYRAAINNVILFVAMLIFQHTVGLFIAVQAQ
ncbi:hypothetical protein PSQ19_19125 [Devosia algicola]|uniref:Sugar ABC transporter permease n=1 Tax=Devosia algicola TaxID=3026418 RepID=A0ABY7YP36_9HYPH|nr:hypothetical protein [Devosia algicola]WDR02655.1 hypothetical protein PSQ19_19125 [Devosia algicola]